MSRRLFKHHRPLFSNTSPHACGKPKMQWTILPFLWLGLKRLALGIGFLVLLNLFLALFILPIFLPKQNAVPSLPDDMVLFLELEDGFAELPEKPTFSDPLAANSPTLKDFIEALDQAAQDERVKGLVARMYDGSFSLTQSAELREALLRFKSTGKFAYIYSTSYGEGGGGLGRYYLASAFDQIWMQPMGIVAINGVHAEVPYFRETLDKIGLKPQFFKRKDYKTAYESVTDTEMSKENRQTLQMVVDDIRAEVLSRVPAERGIETKKFEALVDKGLFTAPEALDARLITHADYADVLIDNVAEAVTGERDAEALNLINMTGYISVMRKKSQSLMASIKTKVALIYVAGAIMPTAEGGGLGGEGIAAADEIAPAIFKAGQDEDVRAIVVRIDSPGGSPSASESILRAIERAKEEGKLVIVSMGSTAASGGYWVAAYADKIFAMPTTLTGSIGVVGGKFTLGDAFDKLGVNWETVSWGQNSGLWSMTEPFNEQEAARYNAMLDHVYSSFVARVAKGRNMSAEDVDKIAGGRVWTGRRAQTEAVGLVDEIGGLETALDYVATQIGLESHADLNVVIYPKPKTPLEQLIELLETQAMIGPGVASMQKRLGEVLQPAMEFMNVAENPQNYTTYNALRVE